MDVYRNINTLHLKHVSPNIVRTSLTASLCVVRSIRTHNFRLVHVCGFLPVYIVWISCGSLSIVFFIGFVSLSSVLERTWYRFYLKCMFDGNLAHTTYLGLFCNGAAVLRKAL